MQANKGRENIIMAFNRFDERRSTYNFEKPRGRALFRCDSPLSSPLFRKKQFLNSGGGGTTTTGTSAASVPSSVASSRESSLDRGQSSLSAGGNEPGSGASFHQVVSKVMSSPKMNLRKRFQVMRSGSFAGSDTNAKSTLDQKRKKWLVERSGSLRLPTRQNKLRKEQAGNSPWSSPEADRRGSLPVSPTSSPLRDRSLDRVQFGLNDSRRGYYHLNQNNNEVEDSGKIKGFVNR